MIRNSSREKRWEVDGHAHLHDGGWIFF